MTAVQGLQVHLRRNPVDAEAWLQLGHALYHLRRYEDAEEALTTALRHRPRFAIAYSNRGLARLDRGDAAGAVSDLDQAIELDPNQGRHYVTRA